MKHYPIIVPALEITWAKEDFQVGDFQSPRSRAAVLAVTQLRAVITQIENLFPAEHPALKEALEWVGRVSEALDEIEENIDTEERLNDPEELNKDAEEDLNSDGWRSPSIDSGTETLSYVLDEYEGCDDFGIDDDDRTDEFIQDMVNYWLDDVLRKQGFNLLSILQDSEDPFEIIKSYEHLAGVTSGT